MQGLRISIPQRLSLLRVLAVFAMLACFACTWRLWTSHRLFPAASLVDGGVAADLLPPYLAITAALCFLASILFKWHRLLLVAGLLIVLTLVLFDLNRLQQWTWILWSLLMVLALYNGRVDDPNKYTSYFIILQIIVCSVYFYSGIHKMQSGFVYVELNEALSPLRSLLSERQFAFILKMGAVIPFVFVFVAFALFIAPLRYLGITFALFIHASLILLLWPLRKGDPAGYLFNIFMIPALVLLFSGRTKQRYFSPGFILQRPVFYPIIAFFLVMPAFNNSGRWPDAMSSNVHSGNNERFTVRFPVGTYLRLPQPVKTFCRPGGSLLTLDHRQWSRFELGMECPEEPHARRAILERLEFWNRGPVKDMELQVQTKLPLLVMP